MACSSTPPVGWTAPPSSLSGMLIPLRVLPPHGTHSGIPPGQTFDYLVPINSSGQHGTFWAHAHANVRVFPRCFHPAHLVPYSDQGQYVDGLRAPLLLHPSNESYQYDEEFTILLGDWYHQEHAVLLQSFISIADPAGNEPVPSKLYHHYFPILA